MSTELSGKRLVSIDRFRGFIVFCMIFFIIAADFPVLGFISRFANTSTTGRLMIFKNMSVADLVDPIFIFLISLSYRHSFERRREKAGERAAYLHFVTRYLGFMGVGSLVVSIEYFVNGESDPCLLQTILLFPGLVLLFGSLIISPIKKIPAKVKTIVGICLGVCLGILGIIGIVLGVLDIFIIFDDIRTAVAAGVAPTAFHVYKHWSILHEIGMAGLLTLPFIRFGTKGRIVAFLACSAAYVGVQLIPFAVAIFNIGILGGLPGAFGYMLIMLGGSTLMSLYEEGKRHGKYLCAVGVLGVLSVLSILFLQMVVRAATYNYIVFSLFVGAVLFYLINLLNFWNPKVQFFVWWGKNPLPIFLVGLVLRLIEKQWNPPPNTQLPLALLVVFGAVGLLTALAYFLYKKDIVLKF